MRRSAFAALALMMAACGSGNSKVTDQGHTLDPKSAVAFSGTLLFFSIGGVIVTDAAGACDAATKAAGAASSCSSSSNEFDPTGIGTDSTSLSISLLPAGEGTFEVPDLSADSDGGASNSLSSFVGVTFTVTQGGQTTFSDTAVSGTVKVDHFKSGGSISGSYDVTMQSGAHLKGSFDGDDCAGLDAALKNSSGFDRSCNSSSNGSSACSGSCSCGGKTVSAACQGPTDGGSGDWTCTCTDTSGATTTCTEPAPFSATDACDENQGCCPLTF